MPNLNSFVRSVPPDLVLGVLRDAHIDPSDLVATEPGPTWRQAARSCVENDVERRASCEARVSRIMAMSDGAGETAIYSLGIHKDVLDGLPGKQARSAWLLLNDRDAFRQAEEIRYTEERRGGRHWDGFCSARDLHLRRDEEAVEAFRAALREFFDSPNIHVEVFDRFRPAFEGDDRALVQVTVYREGHPDQVLEFVDSELSTVSRRPVYEAAVTYEPATGEIEVVGNERHKRGELARLFSGHLLGSVLPGEKLVLRRFKLQGLLQRQEFPTDPEDHIDSVQVTLLRLAPLDGPGERVTLECMRAAERHIWAVSAARFPSDDPLAGGYWVTQAKLTVSFRPSANLPRGRKLTITITMPAGCDLKERTDEELLVGAKYFRRWGLLQEL